MPNHIAAIKTGTDPVAPLPPATFHRTLEEHLYCPKCEASYVLHVDYDWAISRHFEEESRRHITLLRKTIFRGHLAGHRITHFETNGVVVTGHTPPPAPSLEPISRLLQ
jgi:hypothetical protein